MLPLRESIISVLVQAKLTTRRAFRKWRLQRSRQDVLLDDGSDHAHSDLSTSKGKTHLAVLPARTLDRDPLPRSVMCLLIFFIALFVRGWHIDKPDSVVFDEVHFLRFTRAYYYGEYLFDIHPPLGKLVLLVVTYLFCGEPKKRFIHNGDLFDGQVYTPLRWTSALFGSAVAPLSYLICRELGLSVPASLIPAVTQAIEHVAVVESRLVLLDGQLMFFISLCLLFALRMWGSRKGTPRRLRYLIATALSGAAALGVKWTALTTPALVAIVSLIGRPFPAQGRLNVAEMGIAGSIAVALYTSFFALHFWLLPKHGQGDAFMRREFQETLIGNKLYKKGARGPGFVRNFLYLNWEMYNANAHITTRHHWESKWYQWIINQRGLLYFNDQGSTGMIRRIYLIVNPVVTVTTILALVALVVMLLFVYVPRRLKGRLTSYSRLHGFASRSGFLLAGYALNLAPYIEVARCTFLYHYMPALMYALLAGANLVDAIPSIRVQWWISGAYIVAVSVAFMVWQPWIYGSPLAQGGQVWRRIWGESWK